MSEITWYALEERMPTEADADPWGCVLCWNSHDGMMLTGYKNEYRLSPTRSTHWARVPQGPKYGAGSWVPMPKEGGFSVPGSRKPEREDADPWGCVMIWDALNGAIVCGWREERKMDRPYVTHWMKTPDAPGPCDWEEEDWQWTGRR